MGLALSSCSTDLGIDDERFACQQQEDCLSGYECVMRGEADGVCRPAGWAADANSAETDIPDPGDADDTSSPQDADDPPAEDVTTADATDVRDTDDPTDTTDAADPPDADASVPPIDCINGINFIDQDKTSIEVGNDPLVEQRPVVLKVKKHGDVIHVGVRIDDRNGTAVTWAHSSCQEQYWDNESGGWGNEYHFVPPCNLDAGVYCAYFLSDTNTSPPTYHDYIVIDIEPAGGAQSCVDTCDDHTFCKRSEECTPQCDLADKCNYD